MRARTPWIRQARPALAALALALGPAVASAGEVLGVLAAAPPPGPGPELAALAGQLRTALAARAQGVLEPSALRARMVGAAPAGTLAELDQAYAAALTAYGAGDYEQSVRTLRLVASELERLPEGPEVFARWARAMLRMARVEQVLGRTVEAQVDLERLLVAEPEARPDPRQFPPSFLALVDEARQRLAAAPRHRLTVEAAGASAVFVDGREVGAAPAAVEVTAGAHRVAAQRGGVRAAAEQVEVQADRAVRLDTSLAELLRPDGGPGLALADLAGPDVARACARLGLDRAVLVSTLQVEGATWLVAALHDPRRGAPGREGRVRLTGGLPPPRGPDALAAWLLAGTPSELVSTATGPSLALPAAPPPAPGVRPRGSHRHLGLYARVGAGAGYLASSGGGATLSGGAGGVEASLGWTLVENLALGIHGWYGGPMGEGAHATLLDVGPELTWYAMPQNLYLSASAGLSRLALHRGDGTSADGGTGFGAHLALGREWWVGDHLGVGMALQGLFSTTPASGAAVPSYVTWGATLGLSVTYN